MRLCLLLSVGMLRGIYGINVMLESCGKVVEQQLNALMKDIALAQRFGPSGLCKTSQKTWKPKMTIRRNISTVWPSFYILTSNRSCGGLLEDIL